MQQGKHQEYEKKLHEQLLSVSKERLVILSIGILEVQVSSAQKIIISTQRN
jgi:hypothetical protein